MKRTYENLVLIGMSGAGKSTLGVLLAKALGLQFTDTDLLIQAQTGKLLQETIDTEGVERFMQIEEDVVSRLSLQGSVIATGGSVVYSERAMEHLKKHALEKRADRGKPETQPRADRRCPLFPISHCRHLPLHHSTLTIKMQENKL